MRPAGEARAPWRLLAELTKLPIAAASTLTAAAGFLSAGGGLGAPILSMLGGTLLLAMGACALNEWQERGVDARMERTAARPIPSGRISAGAALAISLALNAGGALVLLRHGLAAALLGILALVWYNGVYTPLKRKTPFAVVPGALIGAIPPALGWIAAGGWAGDPGMWALCLVFFLWQVPHFWLLLVKHDLDYGRAGFPTLSTRFASVQTRRVLFVWIAAVTASCGLLPAFRILGTYGAALLLMLPALWLLLAARVLLRAEMPMARVLGLFRVINVFALALITSVSLDPLLRSLHRP